MSGERSQRPPTRGRWLFDSPMKLSRYVEVRWMRWTQMAALNAELKQILDNKERRLPPLHDAALCLEDVDVFPAQSVPGHAAADRSWSAARNHNTFLQEASAPERLCNVPGKSESCSLVWDRSVGALAGKGAGEGRVSDGLAFPRTKQQKETLPPQGRNSRFSEFSKQKVTQVERPQRKVKVKERNDETMKNLRRTAGIMPTGRQRNIRNPHEKALKLLFVS
ncbi:hypothetical protein CCH79_00009541 [Gambusia affinis]|uniref:Uncharacterized protein n=1 Tax=Gambusia affinis TaxID=33528 RepID=A0A315VCX7_GAMAF|nr:hypothetical protein CCH79_00009541 [Gambusia affinis]